MSTPADRRDQEIAELRAKMVAIMAELVYLRTQLVVIRTILDKMTRFVGEDDTDRT